MAQDRIHIIKESLKPKNIIFKIMYTISTILLKIILIGGFENENFQENHIADSRDSDYDEHDLRGNN